MESGAIKDSQINASSETENGTRDQSRLNSGPEKAWCVQESDSVRTLTINLTKPYYITQVTVYTEKVLSPPPPWENVRGLTTYQIRRERVVCVWRGSSDL